MQRALLSLAMAAGVLAAADPNGQIPLEEISFYTSTLGRFEVVTTPASGNYTYPSGAFSAFDVAFNGEDATDLLIEGKNGTVPHYKGAARDVFSYGDAIVLFPMARQVSRKLPVEPDYSAFLSELWFGKDDDCDDGKECMWLHGTAVDITSSRCDGGAATADMYPCWTYPDTADCTPYNTSTGNPDCGNEVTVEYFSQGIYTLSNNTLSGSVICAVDDFISNSTIGYLVYNKTLAVESIAANTIENATTVSFLVVHVVVTTTSIEFPENSYIALNSLVIEVDPLTGTLVFDQFAFSPAPLTHGSEKTTEWDGDTLRFNINTTTILGRSSVPWVTDISPFELLFNTDFRANFDLHGGLSACVANEPAFVMSSECLDLFDAANSTGSIDNFISSLTLDFTKDDVDTFFANSGTVDDLSCGIDVVIGSQNSMFPSGFAFRRTIHIDPPVVPVCAESDSFISYFDGGLAEVIFSEYYDVFVYDEAYTVITPNTNSSTGLLLTIMTEWKGLGLLQNMTSEITLNEDKRCMVGLLNGTMLSDTVSNVGSDPFNPTTIDMCANQTEWDIEVSNTTLPNITVTCNICGLTTFLVDPLAFEYRLPSCNYKPCQNSVLHYFDVVTVDAAKACAVWNETAFAEPLLMTIEMVGSDADGNTDTRNFEIPIFADCITDLGCDGLGYTSCTGLRRRGLWNDIVEEVREVIHDAVDDVLGKGKDSKMTLNPFARRDETSIGRRTIPGTFPPRYADLLYTWLYVSGGVASAGITPAQVTEMRALPVTAWLAYLQGEFPDIDDEVLQNIIDNLKPRNSNGIDVPVTVSLPSAQATFGATLSISAVSMFAVMIANFFMSFGGGVGGAASAAISVAGPSSRYL